MALTQEESSAGLSRKTGVPRQIAIEVPWIGNGIEFTVERLRLQVQSKRRRDSLPDISFAWQSRIASAGTKFQGAGAWPDCRKKG
jgi:hypothetical protein